MDLPQLGIDLMERGQLGAVRYGQALHTHDGRDTMRDLYEELLDAVQYAMKWEMEHPDSGYDDLTADVIRLAERVRGEREGA